LLASIEAANARVTAALADKARVTRAAFAEIKRRTELVGIFPNEGGDCGRRIGLSHCNLRCDGLVGIPPLTH
jgi:hypothetical protein